MLPADDLSPIPSPIPTPLPSPVATADLVCRGESCIQAATDAYADVYKSIREPIEAGLKSCEDCGADCEGCILGGPERQMATVEKTGEQVCDKITGHCDSLLAESYNWGISADIGPDGPPATPPDNSDHRYTEEITCKTVPVYDKGLGTTRWEEQCVKTYVESLPGGGGDDVILPTDTLPGGQCEPRGPGVDSWTANALYRRGLRAQCEIVHDADGGGYKTRGDQYCDCQSTEKKTVMEDGYIHCRDCSRIIPVDEVTDDDYIPPTDPCEPCEPCEPPPPPLPCDRLPPPPPPPCPPPCPPVLEFPKTIDIRIVGCIPSPCYPEDWQTKVHIEDNDTHYIDLKGGPLPPPPPPDPFRQYELWARCGDGVWDTMYVDSSKAARPAAPWVFVDAFQQFAQIQDYVPPGKKGDQFVALKIGACPKKEKPPDQTVTFNGFTLPSLSSINWNDPRVCDALTTLSATLNQSDPHLLSKLFGLRDSAGKPITPSWLGWANNAILGTGAPMAANHLRDMIDAAWGTVTAMPTWGNCDWKQTLVPLAVKGVLAALQGWLKVDLDEVKAPFDLWHNWTCPTDLPSGSSVHDLYNKGLISEQTWECWTRANGSLPAPAKLERQAGENRISYADALKLYRLKQIPLDVFQEIAAANGLRNGTHEAQAREALTDLPSPSDLVMFMTRDAADEELVKRTDADNGFTEKFAGDLKQWAEAQSVPESVMRMHWRSHWRLPSPTQLYEMLHRLRPGRAPAGSAVTREDVLAALSQNDVHPYWRERLASVSYSTITRTDVRTGWESGAIKDEEAKERLQDLGYTAADSEAIFKGWLYARIRKVQNERPVRLAIRGVISWAEADDQLRDLGYTEVIRVRAKGRWLAEIKTRQRDRCAKAIRARVLRGELTAGEATEALIRQGLDTEMSASLAQSYACERDSRSKLPTVANLCDWYARDLISTADYIARLRNLGYSLADATQLASRCHGKNVADPAEQFDPTDKGKRKERGKKGPQ